MKIMIMSDVVPAASAKNEYTDGAIEKLLSDGESGMSVDERK